jgi:hypothetical protein
MLAGDAGTDVDVDGMTQLGPFGPFGTPIEQLAMSSTSREYGTTISADGLEIYFSTYRTPPNAGMSDIWRGTRTDRGSPFGGLTHIAALASTDNDGEPTLSVDGLTLYLNRYLPAPRLYASTRSTPTATDWSIAAPVESPEANLMGFEGADFGPEDLRLVVTNATTKQLYESTRPDPCAPWGPPQLLPGLGGMMGDGYPALRGDGLEIFWESSRQLPQAIYRAERPALDQPFGPPMRVSLGPTVDTGDAGDPDISADGRVLIFVSNASVAIGGEYDVYVVERSPL